MFVVVLRRLHLPGPRRPTSEAPIPEGSRRSRATDRPRRNEYAGQSGTGQPPGRACPIIGINCDSEYFAKWEKPGVGTCTPIVKNGYPLPDPRCTPGGIDRSVTVETLRNPQWRTKCIRDCETSEKEKHVAYTWYNINRPQVNTRENQICELDHLVPLELGGADGMGNIWPECGPNGAVLDDRYFRIKDRVENYLADEVKAGRMQLSDAQRGVAEDWTQYLEAANRYCEAGGRCGTTRR